MRLAAALGCLAVLLASAAPAQAAKRTVPRGFYGAMYNGVIEDRGTHQAAAWDRMAEAGVESARVVFHWGHAEPQRGGPMNWLRSDRAVMGAAARGIALVPVIAATPQWAKQYAGVPASPPARFSDYWAYATKLVQRYGPKGSFWKDNPSIPKRPLRHWQIWNEPELTDHWYRKDKWLPKEAKRYGQLLRGAARAIRKADPGAKIVLAGLTNFAWETLDSLYRHAGIRGAFDIAALHTFPGNWRNVKVIVERFRRALNRRGGSRVPIWITEMAWPAAKGRAQVPPWADTPYYRNFVTTEAGAAKRLEGAYALLASRGFRSRNRLERVHWFSSISSFSGNNIWDYTGLLSYNGDAMEATAPYAAYQKSARKRQGCAKDSAGRCR